jgi:hypothetical protein
MSGIRIVGLGKEHVYAWWPKIKGYVEKAAVKGPGALNPDDLKQGCENGYYQLWLIIRDPNVIGCGITQVVGAAASRVFCRPGIKHIIEPIGYQIKGYICERQL